MSLQRRVDHKKHDLSPHGSFRQKPEGGAVREENQYWVHMPLTLHDMYDMSHSTARNQAFIQEYLYIFLIIKYTGKQPSIMYEEWKNSLMKLSIAVEVTVSPKDEEQTHAMVDGMQYCKMFAADNLHPPHEGETYFTAHLTKEGDVLFPLVTSLAILPCEARKAKLLITGVHNKSNELQSVLDSFIGGQSHKMNSLLGKIVAFKVAAEIPLICPPAVYCAYLQTEQQMIKIMITNTIQMNISIMDIQLYPDQKLGNSSLSLQQVSKCHLPSTIGPLEQFVFLYKLSQHKPGPVNVNICLRWSAEPIECRKQVITTHYHLPSISY